MADYEYEKCIWCGRTFHWMSSGRNHDGFCSDKCKAEYEKQQEKEREA